MAHATATVARNRPSRLTGQSLLWLGLTVLVVLTLYPFVFMFISSFKTYDQFLHDFLGVEWPLHPENYLYAWNIVQHYLLNSIFVSILSTAFTLVFAALSAYVFARHRFPARELLYYMVISLMMIPFIFQLIPRFMLVKDMGLLNTYWALILPYIAGGQLFAIFVLRSFFASLPEELFEAARIDGATDLQIFIKIAVPLSKGILATLAILRIQQVWNDFIWPLVSITNDDLRPISVGLAFLRGEHVTQFGVMFAGYVLASLPLFLIFAFGMKQFIAGITSGAIKV